MYLDTDVSCAGISGAVSKCGVAGANDAETQRQMAILNSFSDLYKFKKSTNQAASTGLWSSVIGGAATAASAGMGTAWGKK